MSEEESGSWAWNVLRIIFLIILTIAPSMVVGFLLFSFAFVPLTWIGSTLLVSGLIFLIGAGILLYSKNIWHWLGSILLGLGVGCGCVILSFLVLLSTIPIPIFGNAAYLTIISIAILLFSISSYVFRDKTPTPIELPMVAASTKALVDQSSSSRTFKSKNEIVLGIELEEIPRDYAYADDKEHITSGMIERFHGVVRHLSLSKIPFALRFQKFTGIMRVLFLTWSNDPYRVLHQQTVLNDTLSNNLTGFRFKKLPHFKGLEIQENENGSAISITGVPLSIEEDTQRKDPLDSIIGILQDLENGILQISIIPSELEKSELRSLESRYRRAIEESETTISKTTSSFFTGERQESKTRVNSEKKRLAETLERQIDRLSNHHLCKTYVTAVSWDPDIAKANLDTHRIASALVGAIQSDNKMDEYHAEFKRKRKDITKVLKGLPIGKPSTLVPAEAAVYFILPRTDVGVRMTKRERFSSGTRETKNESEPVAPQKPDLNVTSVVPTKMNFLSRSTPKIYFGNPIDESGRILDNKWVTLDPAHLDKHLGIFGNIRSGKTSTALSVIGQVITLGIKPVILVPSKSYEWRMLLPIFPDLRIFTCGNDEAALLLLNIWDPPPGVPLSKWADEVTRVLTLWFPNEKVLGMHIDDVVSTIYESCGWCIETNTKGRPILIADFVDGVLKVIADMDYGDEINSNFRGALISRVKSILRKPALVKMFNTSSGITVTDLLAYPTIIEMDSLSSNNKVLVMGILTAAISQYKLANPSKKIENVLVLEEAHYLLSKTTVSGEANSGIRLQAVVSFIEILRVLGGTGLGVILLDQLPSRLVTEAIKLPVNIIIHSLSHEDDRWGVGKAARCTDAQIEHIGGMETGETVIFLQPEGEPKNVKIRLLTDFIMGELPNRSIPDEEVREHMNKIFEEHPHLGESEPLPDGLKERLKSAKSSQLQAGQQGQFAKFLNLPDVAEFCISKLSSGTDEDVKKLGNVLRQAINDLGSNKTTSVLFLIGELRNQFEDSENAHLFQRLFEELIDEPQ